MKNQLEQLKKELKTVKDQKQAEILQKFFKTGKGQYGEGDVFLGIKVPLQRKIAKKYTDLDLKHLQILLNSPEHEFRLIALFILIIKYDRGDQKIKKEIFNFYLKNTKNINNWDLVDLSSPNILGDYLLFKKRDLLYRLAKSNNLWEKRIAILATFPFIKNGESLDIFKIAQNLLKTEEDLIQKAIGWMLREVGKRIGEEKEEEFLKKNYQKMPRTMLRYAIERFEESKRKKYLKNQI